jgi:hypothetical protein
MKLEYNRKNGAKKKLPENAPGTAACACSRPKDK